MTINTVDRSLKPWHWRCPLCHADPYLCCGSPSGHIYRDWYHHARWLAAERGGRPLYWNSPGQIDQHGDIS